MKNVLLSFILLGSIATQAWAKTEIEVNESDFNQISESVEAEHYPIVPIKLNQTYYYSYYDLDASIISKKKLNEIFKLIKSKKDRLQYHKYIGGCESRAIEIAQILDEMSIVSIKVFAHGPLYYKGREWKFHVAPVVLVLENNQIVPYAIDPTLDDSAPISVSSWRSKTGVKILDRSPITNRFAFLPKDIRIQLSDYRSEDLAQKEKALLLLKGFPENPGFIFNLFN